jgi:hypothetical protein
MNVRVFRVPQEFLAFERFGVKSIADDWQRFGLVGICA